MQTVRQRKKQTKMNKWFFAAIFVGNVAGKTLQNVCLPLVLSTSHVSMAAMITYTGFVYFVFFALLDVILDIVVGPVEAILQGGDRVLMGVALQNSLNAVGTVFGGNSARTPLTMQMSFALLVNLLAPFFKFAIFGVACIAGLKKCGKWFVVAATLYLVAFVLTLMDTSGSINGFCALFVMGALFGVTYNIYQERAVECVDYGFDVGWLVSLKLATSVLRKQVVWLFLFSWMSVALAAVPHLDQAGGIMEFQITWIEFLFFENFYMNLFILGALVSFMTGVFMNKYDSSFNMLISNVSAVFSLWPGWLPDISQQTVGFTPSVKWIVPAMILSALAIYPSYLYSLESRALIMEYRSNGFSAAVAAASVVKRRSLVEEKDTSILKGAEHSNQESLLP